MEAFLSGPLEVSRFGGPEALARRVAKDQAHGGEGQYRLARQGRRQVLLASFRRHDFVCRYEFASSAGRPLALREASIVGQIERSQYAAWTVSVDTHSLNVSVAADEDRAWCLRCDRAGSISGLALPFGPREVLTVPKLAIMGYVTEAAILASWSIMAAVALCRCDEEGLGEVLSIEDDLIEGVDVRFQDITRRFGLRLGLGKTAISLPSWRVDGIDA